MKRCCLVTILIFFLSWADAQDSVAIKKTIFNWNKAISTKNITLATSVFDNDAKVIFAGSEQKELFKGIRAIRQSIKEFFKKPLTLSWDLTNMTIDENKGTAWVFVDGTVTLKWDNGTVETSPYRTTVVMVKKANTWKWRLFDGSAPEKPTD